MVWCRTVWRLDVTDFDGTCSCTPRPTHQHPTPIPQHPTKAYTDSSTITQYLEYFFPGERPLTIEDPELDEAVKAATGGVFGAFARWVVWAKGVWL